MIRWGLFALCILLLPACSSPLKYLNSDAPLTIKHMPSISLSGERVNNIHMLAVTMLSIDDKEKHRWNDVNIDCTNQIITGTTRKFRLPIQATIKQDNTITINHILGDKNVGYRLYCYREDLE